MSFDGIVTQYKCSVRHRSFSLASNSKIHLKRTQNGEKPFECCMCYNSLSISGNLKIYLRTHTGEKPFEYSVCVKSFSICVNPKKHHSLHRLTKSHPKMSPPLKKPRVNLSIAERLDIINASESGECPKALSKKYNVSVSSIWRLLRDKDVQKTRLVGFVKKFSANRKRVYNPRFPMIDDAVFMWVSQQCSLGIPVSGTNICDMAQIFSEKLLCPPGFVASRGWLHRFQQRHKIKSLAIQGEKLTAKHVAAETYPMEFQQIVEGVHPSNLYNADERGLFWRAFPTSTFVNPGEVGASGIERNKDRVTLLFCANATGTHALPLLMIGKSKAPPCWRNIRDMSSLPVIYSNQQNVWMTAMNFFDWFGSVFIDEVKRRQLSDGNFGKVVLVLDNAGCHPPKKLLDTVDNDFVVEYLPPLFTSILQPMDQGAVACMKRKYRRALVRKLLIDQQDSDVMSFQKGFTLNDCAQLAAQAWGEVPPFMLAWAWRKLLGHEHTEKETGPAPSPELGILKELRRVAPTILPAEVDEWMLADDLDPGHAIMTIDEIVESVREANDDECVSSEELELRVEVTEQPTATTLQDTISGLETAVSFFQDNNNDSRFTEYRLQLKEMLENL